MVLLNEVEEVALEALPRIGKARRHEALYVGVDVHGAKVGEEAAADLLVLTPRHGEVGLREVHERNDTYPKNEWWSSVAPLVLIIVFARCRG